MGRNTKKDYTIKRPSSDAAIMEAMSQCGEDFILTANEVKNALRIKQDKRIIT